MKVKLDTEKLIAKYLLGDITGPEKEQLDNWVRSSPEREAFFNKLRTNASFRERYESYSHINSHLAWKRFKKQYCQSSAIAASTLLKYAAIFIFPILIGTGGWYMYSSSKIQASYNLSLEDAIQPGIIKATLKLSENNKQTLTPTCSTPVKVNRSITAIAQNGTLIYPTVPDSGINNTQNQKSDIIENNILTTNQDNEFRVTFEDGTSVHINYNTERYPVKFSKSKHMVYLKGEAYFKVAKDTRPFYVITDQGTIKQYRTEFNVNTFNSKQTEIALVKESMSVTSKGSSKKYLMKSEQLAHTNTSSEDVTIYDADLIPYIAWNEGRLIFENRTLESIVEILKHWHNVDISFGSPEVKQLRFTGNMDQYATITPILKAIARTTNLRISIEDRDILIKNIRIADSFRLYICNGRAFRYETYDYV